MTLLDAYALIALLANGPAREEVRGLLREGDAAVATANLVEVLDVAERIARAPQQETWKAIEPLLEEVIDPIPLSVEIARRAAAIRARHYHRRDCPLSLADSVLLATGGEEDRIATADPHVLSVGRKEGLEPIPLPGDA